jgi:hypothetical protein
LKWQISESEDEFGDPTGKFSLTGGAIGRFSNSATLDDRLLVMWRLNSAGSEMIFKLAEYGDILATFYDRNDEVSYSVKEADGDKYSFKTRLYKYFSEYQSLYLKNTPYRSYDNSLDRLLQTFNDGGIVEIHISVGYSEYHFEVDCTDFPKLWDELQALHEE